MVETKTTVGLSVLSAIIGAILILGGVNIMEDEVYYCEARGTVMSCDSLSKYYSLPNGKCWNSELGNKLCRSGWLKGVNDEVPSDEPEPVDPPDNPIYGGYSVAGKVWDCPPNKVPCVLVEQ